MRATLSIVLLPVFACAVDVDPDLDTSDATGSAMDESETGAGESTDTGEPAGCLGMGLAPGDHEGALNFEGATRRYQLHVPPAYNGAPTPLVFNFHGWTSNAGQQRLFSGMDAHSDAESYLVVYPEGLRNANNDTAWNAGGCCADDDRDDVGFTMAVLDVLNEDLCIDPKRVFATGMSNGGFMSYRIGCELSEIFAAIAPVAGGLVLPLSECNPTRDMPALAIHGTADPTVSFSDGAASIEAWRTMNGCDATSTVTLQNGVATCEAYDGCRSGADVTFCTVEGVGHCWPGQLFCISGTSTEDLVSNAEMWSFFLDHPLP